MIFLKTEQGRKYQSEILNRINENYNEVDFFDSVKISVEDLKYGFDIKYDFILNKKRKDSITIAIQPDKDQLREQLSLELKVAQNYDFELETCVDFKLLL